MSDETVANRVERWMAERGLSDDRPIANAINAQERAIVAAALQWKRARKAARLTGRPSNELIEAECELFEAVTRYDEEEENQQAATSGAKQGE